MCTDDDEADADDDIVRCEMSVSVSGCPQLLLEILYANSCCQDMKIFPPSFVDSTHWHVRV